MSTVGEHSEASDGDSGGFGDELAELSEAELEERANKSVQEFYSHGEQEATEWRESILDDEAEKSLDEFYNRFGGLKQGRADTLSEWRESFLEQEAESAFEYRTELFNKSAEAHLENPEWRSKFSEFVDTGVTQTGGSSASVFGSSFDDSQLGQAKGESLDIVAQNPNGVQFSKVAKAVLDDEAIQNATYQYKQLKDWITESEYTQTSESGGIWVEPSLHLSKQYASRKTARQQDGANSNGQTGAELEPQYPKDRVKSILDKRVRLDDGDDGDLHDYRLEFLRELATELANIDDKWTIFERIRKAEYLLIPYLTRFNDDNRAGETQEGFNFALKTAARDYHNAILLTVTVDPKRFDSHSEALESLTDKRANLVQWLSTEYQLGYRPENMSVLEYQENGLPHYHIVLFGCTWLASQEQLSAKWSGMGVGSVVDVRSVGSRNGSWIMHKDGVTTTLSDYLGKSIQELVDLSSMSVAELQEQVDSGDIHLWRQALYWATGKQYYSCSPSLKESNDGDSQPHIAEWRFVGVAEYSEIPSHVVQNSVNRGRPPPD
jgi:hypothetical protein